MKLTFIEDLLYAVQSALIYVNEFNPHDNSNSIATILPFTDEYTEDRKHE